MPKSRSQILVILNKYGLGSRLSYAQMSKWLNNISRDLQNVSRGRGTSRTKTTLILGVHLHPAKKNRTKFKSQLAKVFTRQMALHCMQQISV